MILQLTVHSTYIFIVGKERRRERVTKSIARLEVVQVTKRKAKAKARAN